MLCWLLWLLEMNPALSQSYYSRHYQTENGLSNNSITCRLQDKRDSSWFGTKEGLNRFDGYQFKLFHLDDDYERTLTRDLIFSLIVDQQGAMWVGSERIVPL